MKIKKFNENVEDIYPDVGDYVIVCEEEPRIDNFTLNNIGQIIPIPESWKKKEKIYLFVQYEYIPPELSEWFRTYGAPRTRIFSKDEVLFCGKNKEQLELKIFAKKYNL
jgi:hypothetical protein